MTSNSIQQSYVGFALEKGAFRIQETDSRITAIGKFTAGRAANTVIALAALVETVFFASITALSSPLYFLSPERFSILSGHTTASAKAGVQALKEIIGTIDQAVQQETLKPSSTKWEKVFLLIRESAAKLGQNPGKTAGAVLTGIALVTLFNYRSSIFTFLEKNPGQCLLEEAPLLALPHPDDVQVPLENAYPLVLRAKAVVADDYSAFGKNALYYRNLAIQGLAFAGKRTGQVALIGVAAVGAGACTAFGVGSLLLE